MDEWIFEASLTKPITETDGLDGRLLQHTLY